MIFKLTPAAQLASQLELERRMRKLPTFDTLFAQAQIALAVFGGAELTHAAKRYIHDAQLHFGTLEVEGALDGRELYVRPRPEWAQGLNPKCPACGNYLLPCTKTASGTHPGLGR